MKSSIYIICLLQCIDVENFEHLRVIQIFFMYSYVNCFVVLL